MSIIAKNEHEIHVNLSATAYVYFLHLAVPDEYTHFSDNYFDLEPGEQRTIVVTNTHNVLTPGMISVRWR